jgi:predicted nucleic acid-binding protein
MIKSTIRVVCDAGPIIHLDELGYLDLLSDFQEIFLSDTVWKEIGQYRPSALKRMNLSLTRSRGVVPSDEPLLTMCRMFSLDAGEIEALALMEQMPQAMFLTDDAAARLVAEQMGFKVHGTIGILVRSIRRGQRKPEEVVRVLTEMPLKSTLYIKPPLLEEIMLKIKKEYNLYPNRQ